MGDPFLAGSEGAGNVVLDIDGVVLLGGDAIPGAGETISRLRDLGLKLVFATNNSTRTAADVADRIAGSVGVDVGSEEVVTSSIATLAVLGDGDDPILTLGESGLDDTLAGAGHHLTREWQAAHAVVVGLDRGVTYERLSAATRAVRNGARFVGTNGDVTFPVAGGQVPGAGAIIAAVSAAAERPPEIAGKPNPPMRNAIRSRLGPGPVWMVGDRPETDLAMAATEGWKSVLVLSGVTTRESDLPAGVVPDLVLESVAGLIEAIA